MRPTRIFRTTGFRLATIYLGLFGLSVLILLSVIYWITSDALRQQLTVTIEREVAALVEDHQSGGLSSTAASVGQRLASGQHPTTFYLLLGPDGGKISGNLPSLPPHDGWQELSVPRPQGDASDDSEDGGERQFIALGTVLPDRAFLLVGEDTFRLVEVQEAIIRAFVWAFGVMVLLGAIGGGLLSLGFLSRIDAINRTSRAIMEGRLTNRVPTRGTDDELDHLARNLNEMLDQVQALMESLRQVSNEIAHDLRTPLSHLRQRLEEVRREARCMEDYEGVVDQAVADTDAILKTFTALLRIAQIEAGTRKAAFSTVDLSNVFQSIADAYAMVAEDRGQTFATSIEPNVSVRGDRDLLMQMLANLVENAIRHTPEGTRINFSLEHGPEGPVGTIADSGPGIPEKAREKVFQRFFRLERSRGIAGNGLGLSLVAAVADIHGFTITLADNEPGLMVRLDFAPGARG